MLIAFRMVPLRVVMQGCHWQVKSADTQHKKSGVA